MNRSLLTDIDKNDDEVSELMGSADARELEAPPIQL